MKESSFSEKGMNILYLKRNIFLKLRLRYVNISQNNVSVFFLPQNSFLYHFLVSMICIYDGVCMFVCTYVSL